MVNQFGSAAVHRAVDVMSVAHAKNAIAPPASRAAQLCEALPCLLLGEFLTRVFNHSFATRDALEGEHACAFNRRTPNSQLKPRESPVDCIANSFSRFHVRLISVSNSHVSRSRRLKQSIAEPVARNVAS